MQVIQDLVERFRKSFSIEPLFSKIQEGAVIVKGLYGSSKALFLLTLYRIAGRGVIFITRNNREAGDIYGDLKLFANGETIYQLPSKETLPYDESAPHRALLSQRITALCALSRKEKALYVVPVRSLIDYYMPHEIFKKSIIRIKKGDEIQRQQLESLLDSSGYTRVERVVEEGNYAFRGDICDIYGTGASNPVRIEFFDTIVESVREFSPVTQRSIRVCDSVLIPPARELVINEQVRQRLKTIQEDDKSHVANSVLEFGWVKGAENYLSLLYERPSYFTDYSGKEYIYVFDSSEECARQGYFFLNEAKRIYRERQRDRYYPGPLQIVAPFDSVIDSIGKYIDLVTIADAPEVAINFGILEKKGYRGKIQFFKGDVEQLLKQGYRVLVGSNYRGQTNRLREILRDLENRYNELHVETMDLTEGFVSPEMKLAIILDREIFNRKRRYNSSFVSVTTQPIEGIFDIEEGDYIVHIEHGIGIYRGIEKLNTGETEKDFIKIEYREGDEIFIPVDQINLLQKYIGYKGRVPRIDRLGSDTWKRIKEHVKKSVKNLAGELLEIYSTRAALRGHSFSKDTDWQYEFESGFQYEETPDQVRTIEEIKRDMEDERPMDRLICGDVGFGKTEVAIRASFKAVMDGKQVAVLVPTTILAEQHLNTFRDRFALYPVTVEMLSRFRTPKEQKQIIENLKKGLIDVIIGTHRLIQKDVQFKDLGLVIIDEEQRFGVEHKERFKQLRKLVDVITMTATPIPRTLYMSMTKIRDMSIIETPPQDRVPIETYVLEYNEEIIVDAIRREVERGGQVYYVHNRIMTIEEKAEKLRMLMPDISFEVAHGRMDEQELEQIMKSFFDMEFQVLVSTTIIESGLDIPNVNTIIIERADRFGLAQLYQLRGRVGRSARKAYAYLLYPSGRIIGEKAQKRLTVINDYTELGAGFSIALKDLEIRGAGNILGREQHGDILAVGFEMYVKLLDEAIRKLKEGEAYEEEIEPVIDVSYKGYIPSEYIGSEKLRIEVYKKLAAIKQRNELNELAEELIDRFGAIPPPLVNLFDIVKIKILCRDVGIKFLREKENELQLTFEKSKIDILGLIQKISTNRKIFSISPRDYNTLHVYKKIPDNSNKYEFLKELFAYDDGSEK